MAAKPRALFLTPESPYPMVGGGAMRSASILEYLLQHYETDVLCFRQPGAPSWQPPHGAELPFSNLRSWKEIPLPLHGRSPIQRGWRNLRRAWRGVPPLVDRFAGFQADLEEALAGQHYDVGIVEHFWCATYAAQLRPHCARLTLDLHNLESLWHQRCAGVLSPWVAPLHHAFARAALRLEQELLPQFDLILTTSQQECNYISVQFPELPVHVVANAVQWQERPRLDPEESIVFSGNMEYLPNQKAALYFAKSIWPAILRQHPRLHWKILGKGASQMQSLLASTRNLQIVADPEDAMMEIARSLVAVVPLTTGTGTRLKIIEAWAAGCPVVSTSIGAEGLAFRDGIDILIHDDPGDFAASVSRLVDNPAAAGSLADEGRQRFEHCYSWKSAWEALSKCGL